MRRQKHGKILVLKKNVETYPESLLDKTLHKFLSSRNQCGVAVPYIHLSQLSQAMQGVGALGPTLAYVQINILNTILELFQGLQEPETISTYAEITA